MNKRRPSAKVRGGFDPSRLLEPSRPASVISGIVSSSTGLQRDAVHSATDGDVPKQDLQDLTSKVDLLSKENARLRESNASLLATIQQAHDRIARLEQALHANSQQVGAAVDGMALHGDYAGQASADNHRRAREALEPTRRPGDRVSASRDGPDGRAQYVELVASPFYRYTSFSAFLRSVRQCPDVVGVDILDFDDGSLRLGIRFSHPLPPLSPLLHMSGFELQLVSFACGVVEVAVLNEDAL